MTRRVGDVVVIASEEAAPCTDCGQVKELRPYGAGGARICFDCAMSTPEKRAETDRRFASVLDGDEGGGLDEPIPYRLKRPGGAT